MEVVSQFNFLTSNKAEKRINWRAIIENEHIENGTIVQDKQNPVSGLLDENAVLKQLYTDGLVLLDYRFASNHEGLWEVKTSGDCIIMEFFLNATISHSKKKEIDFHNLRYRKGSERSFPIKAQSAFDVFYVVFSKSFFLKLLSKTSKVNEAFSEMILKDEQVNLSDVSLPMNFQMNRIINDVRTCTRKGDFHRFCLEIKLLELLLLQFEQMHQLANDTLDKPSFHENDIACIKEAKAILVDKFNTPPTIRRLSQMVGINESKLKSGFKEIFHSTIHEYVIRLRMERANELVKSQNIPIKEVAMEIGYKNPSHFSAAFKKHFGFLPTEMVG